MTILPQLPMQKKYLILMRCGHVQQLTQWPLLAPHAGDQMFCYQDGCHTTNEVMSVTVVADEKKEPPTPP